MGQHKYNPKSIAAKNGELPPKPVKKSKRQIERELQQLCYNYLYSRTGIGNVLYKIRED